MKKLLIILLILISTSLYSQSFTTGYKFWTKDKNGKMEINIVTSAQLPEFLKRKNIEWVAKIPKFTSSFYSEVQTDSVYCYVETGTVFYKKSGKTKFKRAHK